MERESSVEGLTIDLGLHGMSKISTGRQVRGEHPQIEETVHAKKDSWGTIGNAVASNAIGVLFSLPEGLGQQRRKRDWEPTMDALNARLRNGIIVLQVTQGTSLK